MKIAIYSIISCICLSFVFTSCDTEVEPIEIQKLIKRDDAYYASLRAYKQTDHTIYFGWYAAYAPVEGVSGYKDPASWGERIIGLPDSLDIVSLWMGIPDEVGSPIAYKDLWEVKKKKGTRFVVPTIVRMNKTITLRDGSEYDLSANHNDAGIEVFGQYLVDQVLDSNLDGVDLDYEPEGDWMQGDKFVKLVKYIGQYFGPKGQYSDKLLCVDFYGQYPPSETEPYVDYFIRQSYGAGSAYVLQSQYNWISWAPPSKFIVTETFGDYYSTGGVEFTEADGNTISEIDGERMHSLEGMARWNPTQGKKAGFGAFYFGRDYYSKKRTYHFTRKAVQAANPSNSSNDSDNEGAVE